MKNENFSILYDNRLMRNDKECEVFDTTIELIYGTITSTDIVELVHILDDNTNEQTIMFGLIHLIEEYVISENDYILLFKGISDISFNSPEWSKIILYRLLNDKESVIIIKKIFKTLDSEIYNNIYRLFMNILDEDPEIFKETIEDIIV